MNFNQQTLMKTLGIAAGVGFILGIGSGIPFVNFACCCIGIFIWGAGGALYGYFEDSAGNPVDMGTWIAGGAAAGAVMGITRGIANGIMVGILSLLGAAGASASQLAQLEDAGVPPELVQIFASSGGNAIVTIIAGVCIHFFLVAVVGAIGAAIFAAIKNGQSNKTPAAV